MNKLDRFGTEVAFNFVDNKKVQKIYVDAAMQDQLSRGRLAIVALNDAYEVVPSPVADKILERDEATVVFRNARDSDESNDDDPYADYPIPDDLMW